MSDQPQPAVHQRIADPAFRQAVDLMDAGNTAGLEALLNQHPELTTHREAFPDRGYFQSPSLLEFIAENPVRHGRLPANALDIARAIIANAPPPDRRSLDETLTLVASGRVVREANVQVPLIDLLCAQGADADTAIEAALGHGEFDAVEALLSNGAELTLPIAAATGRLNLAFKLLPKADSEQRHRALALSAQHGHAEITRIMLGAGEDPDRYNPPACHAHSTPLHQAALAGHESVVRTLLAHGARRDLLDTIHNAPPASWASHAGHKALAEILHGG
ncbi:MAG: ankyrin repeat domain-containing protein [Paracoccaceae bacterium]